MTNPGPEKTEAPDDPESAFAKSGKAGDQASLAGGPDGWELDRRDKLRAALQTTPAQRLRWLEDAMEFAWRAGALPRRDRRAGEGT